MRSVLRAYRDAFSGLTRDMWVLGVTALINRSGTMVLPFMSIYLTTERGLSIPEAGRLVATYGIGSVCGAYLGGWLADRIGAVRAQQASLVSGGVSLLLVPGIENPRLLALALFVVGTLVEALRPAVMTAVAERTPLELKAKAFAFLRLTSNLGIGIGASIGGTLALYSFSFLFVGDAVTCFAAALLLLKVADVERGRASASGAETRGSPLRDPPFLCLVLFASVLASALFQLFSTLPLYFREDLGFRENVIGMLLAFNTLLIVLFEMVLIHAVAGRNRMYVAGVGAFLLCCGFALMPFHGSLWYIALTVAVWTFGEMLSLPILSVIAAERAGAGVQGRYLGLYTMAYSVAFIVAPIAGTHVYDTLGPDTLWRLIGVVGAGLGLAAVVLKRYLKS